MKTIITTDNSLNERRDVLLWSPRAKINKLQKRDSRTEFHLSRIVNNRYFLQDIPRAVFNAPLNNLATFLLSSELFFSSVHWRFSPTPPVMISLQHRPVNKLVFPSEHNFQPWKSRFLFFRVPCWKGTLKRPILLGRWMNNRKSVWFLSFSTHFLFPKETTKTPRGIETPPLQSMRPLQHLIQHV